MTHYTSGCRFAVGGADGCDRLAGGLLRIQKKRTGCYSAQRAAIGARTFKSGQSRFFVGYKKHTFRLWIARYERGVLLVPLVSWAAPANLSPEYLRADVEDRLSPNHSTSCSA